MNLWAECRPSSALLHHIQPVSQRTQFSHVSTREDEADLGRASNRVERHERGWLPLLAVLTTEDVHLAANTKDLAGAACAHKFAYEWLRLSNLVGKAETKATKAYQPP